MTDAEKVVMLRSALAGILPVAEQNGPAPFALQEWARRVMDASLALSRTDPKHDDLTRTLLDIAGVTP